MLSNRSFLFLAVTLLGCRQIAFSKNITSSSVMPAKAGIQSWIPAYAGMTNGKVSIASKFSWIHSSNIFDNTAGPSGEQVLPVQFQRGDDRQKLRVIKKFRGELADSGLFKQTPSSGKVPNFQFMAQPIARMNADDEGQYRGWRSAVHALKNTARFFKLSYLAWATRTRRDITNATYALAAGDPKPWLLLPWRTLVNSVTDALCAPSLLGTIATEPIGAYMNPKAYPIRLLSIDSNIYVIGGLATQRDYKQDRVIGGQLSRIYGRLAYAEGPERTDVDGILFHEILHGEQISQKTIVIQNVELFSSTLQSWRHAKKNELCSSFERALYRCNSVEQEAYDVQYAYTGYAAKLR